MANPVRLVIAIFCLTLLVTVTLVQKSMSDYSFKSLMSVSGKGIRGQKMVSVKQYRERIGEAVVTYSTGDQHLRERSCYKGRTLSQVEVGATESKNRGSRKVKQEFDSKRSIPGGPDAQHHGNNGR